MSESASSRSTRRCIRSVRTSRGRCTPGRSVRTSCHPCLDVGGDAADRAAGGLRAVGDDRDVGADDRVDQRRLAGVRTPGEADEARSRRGLAHFSDAMTFACSASISPSVVHVVVTTGG